MINLNWANSQASTIRDCAGELQSVINSIDQSLSQIESTDNVTASPVRVALRSEQGMTQTAQRLLYELADQIVANAYEIYEAELEEQRRIEEERQREEEERRRREEE